MCCAKWLFFFYSFCRIFQHFKMFLQPFQNKIHSNWHNLKWSLHYHYTWPYSLHFSFWFNALNKSVKIFLLILLWIFPQLSGGCELTVVIHDFVASNGGSNGELTVRRGQTVEVLERLHDKPDWCLVRTTDRSPAQEGIVPCSMLCIAHSRSSMEMEGLFNHKGRSMFLTNR